MGSFLNPGNILFFEDINSEIYKDKTLLIDIVNKKIRTKQKCLCVSRPRRFGKTMAMNMLTAYYSKGCDSAELFAGRKITQMPSYQEHLNKHNVIRIGMQEFLGKERTVDGMIKKLCAYVSKEIFREYPDIDYVDKNDFIQVLRDVYEETKIKNLRIYILNFCATG